MNKKSHVQRNIKGPINSLQDCEENTTFLYQVLGQLRALCLYNFIPHSGIAEVTVNPRRILKFFKHEFRSIAKCNRDTNSMELSP